MICKYCGTSIANNVAQCPHCGHEVKLDGGVGFWDMAGKPRVVERPVRQDSNGNSNISVPQIKTVSQSKTEKPKVRSNYQVMMVCVSLLFCVLSGILLIGLIRNQSMIRKISDKYQVLVLKTDANLEEIAELRTRLAQLEMPSEDKLENTHSSKIKVSPVDLVVPMNFENNEQEYCFRFLVEGNVISFEWEKQAEDGSWIKLCFDEDGIDTRFGVKLMENTGEGLSELAVISKTDEGCGIYKCSAYTFSGKEVVTAKLSYYEDLFDALVPYYPTEYSEGTNNEDVETTETDDSEDWNIPEEIEDGTDTEDNEE